MFGWSKKPKIRRRQVREHRARITVPVRTRLAATDLLLAGIGWAGFRSRGIGYHGLG